jgi:hypothetical protein
MNRYLRSALNTLVATGLSACGHAVISVLYLSKTVVRPGKGQRPTTPERRRAPRDVGAGAISMGLGLGPANSDDV